MVADVMLPPAAVDHEFRVYRAGDLMLVRNTGSTPLWIRGRSVDTGSFLRMRERQPLVVPGWTLSYEDLLFFLDVKRTGNAPAIYLAAGDAGLTAERTRSRQSVLRVRFGLQAEVEALRDTDLHAGSRGPLKKGDVVICRNHERLGDESGFSLSINELRRKATQSGRRFRLAGDRQEYLVSNDAAALARGDLLLGPKLSPKTVLFIRYDAQRAEGELQIRESNGPILVDGAPVRLSATLKDGSLIRLSGSQSVRCRFSEGFLDEERTLIESLRVEDLIHDFGPDARALDHINFEVKRGEMLCIIGPSGSGKSTLLAVLSGQREPTRGQVKLNGISLYERREHLVPVHRPHAAGGGAQSAAHGARTPAPRRDHPPPGACRSPNTSGASTACSPSSACSPSPAARSARRATRPSPAANAAASISAWISAAGPRCSCSTNRSPGCPPRTPNTSPKPCARWPAKKS